MTLVARVERISPTDKSIPQKLVNNMAGEVRTAVEREDHVPLFGHDVVAPQITKDTDIPSTAVRSTLRKKRTTERCKRYLSQQKRVRMGGSGRRVFRLKILTMVRMQHL